MTLLTKLESRGLRMCTDFQVGTTGVVEKLSLRSRHYPKFVASILRAIPCPGADPRDLRARLAGTLAKLDASRTSRHPMTCTSRPISILSLLTRSKRNCD